MKLTSLASSSTTSLEFKHPITGELTGVVIFGNTPDSNEYRAAQKALVDPRKKQSIIIEKTRNLLEIDSDAAEKRRKLVTEMVTDLTGFDDWEYSKENVVALFENPLYSWMEEQWTAHLDDRANFFGKPETSAKSGAKVTPGSTATKKE